MKRNHACPECASHEIHVTQVHSQQGTNLMSGVNNFVRSVILEAYICGNCGCYRLFVPERDLADVIEKLPKLREI